MVELRPVEESDSERLFTWRNLPEVRQYMFNDGTIRLDGHLRWLAKILVDPTRRDWIIEHDEVPVGLISLTDIDDDNRRFRGPEFGEGVQRGAQHEPVGCGNA